jgi:hypothetical protein
VDNRNEKNRLMKEIQKTTSEVREKILELYVHLFETPLFISVDEHDLELSDFQQYLSFA